MSATLKPLSLQIAEAEASLKKLESEFAQMVATQVMFTDMVEDHQGKLLKLEQKLNTARGELEALRRQQQLVM
jgi:hypothetical protein